jgi:hypothetical protein
MIRHFFAGSSSIFLTTRTFDEPPSNLLTTTTAKYYRYLTRELSLSLIYQAFLIGRSEKPRERVLSMKKNLKALFVS